MKNKGNKLICYMFLVLCIALAIAIGMLLFTLTPPPSTPPNTPEQEEPNNNENNEDDEQNNGDNNEGDNSESNDNNDDNNNGSEEIPTPTLTVPTNINLDLLQTNFVFEYSVTNLADFVVSISIDDTSIATIDSNNIITPLKVGETKIITSINTNPTIAKETTLKINDCVQNVNFSITNEDGSVPNIFFTGTSYILKLEQNILEENPPIITNNNSLENIPKIITNNIKNIQLKSVENKTYFYNFEINSYGNFSFEYKGEYINKNLENFAYIKPNNFDINFNNIEVINNTINLYLFNNNFTNEANLDGYYNTTTFNIIKETNSYDDIVITTTNYNNVISLTNNTISAIKTGSTTITFYSNISKVSKSYNIIVNKIELSSLIINNKNIALNTTNNIELGADESYSLYYYPSPSYAICSLSEEFNSEEISFTNNKITLLNNTTKSTFTIKNNFDTVYTLNISAKSLIHYTLEVTTNTCEYSFNKDTNTLEATLNSYPLIQLKCTAINSLTGIPLPTQSFIPEIKDTIICKLMLQDSTSGYVDIRLLSAGTTTLTITNTINMDIIEITIIVKE